MVDVNIPSTPGAGMPGQRSADMATCEVIVSSRPGAPFEQLLRAGEHHLVADEPIDVGGGDAGPNPYDYLLMALGSCTSMTLRLYADRKGWPLEGVVIGLRHERVHVRDCVDCETGVTAMERIHLNMVLHGELDDEQRDRLLDIANKCPVHRTLTGKMQIVTSLAGSGSSAA